VVAAGQHIRHDVADERAMCEREMLSQRDCESQIAGSQKELCERQISHTENRHMISSICFVDVLAVAAAGRPSQMTLIMHIVDHRDVIKQGCFISDSVWVASQKNIHTAV